MTLKTRLALHCVGAALSSLVLATASAQTTSSSTPAAAAATPAVSAALNKNMAPGFAGLAARDKVLLMPVDVELFSLTLSNITEPKADWTATAQQHMKAAIVAKKAKLGLSTIEGTDALADEFGEQVGLHAAVARSIALHHTGPGVWALPSKGAQLLWSFGDAMQGLADKTGARYGLFTWVRDSYATAERKAAMVAMALLGVGVAGGVQQGYASLVDLQTGQVVWFNLLARAHGDLREPASAAESIEALLSGFPQAR